MKRFILTLTTIFMCTITHAQTIDIDWLVDNSVYNQSTCEYGGDLIVPIAPTKYGYTFNGWVSYTPIEYLESTGTQWIDPYYTTNINTKIVTRTATLNPGGDNYIMRSANSALFILSFFNNHISWHMCVNERLDSKITTSEGTAYDIEAYNGVLKINGIMYQCSPYNIISNTEQLKIFAKGSIKIYYFQIYDNDVLVRDFIPVLDKDGTPCMFDKEEGKFYYNAGTGQFVAGPVIGE